jgi:hypothetical protein
VTTTSLELLARNEFGHRRRLYCCTIRTQSPSVDKGIAILRANTAYDTWSLGVVVGSESTTKWEARPNTRLPLRRFCRLVEPALSWFVSSPLCHTLCPCSKARSCGISQTVWPLFPDCAILAAVLTLVRTRLWPALIVAYCRYSICG